MGTVMSVIIGTVSGCVVGMYVTVKLLAEGGFIKDPPREDKHDGA